MRLDEPVVSLNGRDETTIDGSVYPLAVHGVGVADVQEHRHGGLVGLDPRHGGEVQVDLSAGGKGVVTAFEAPHREAQPPVASGGFREVPHGSTCTADEKVITNPSCRSPAVL